MYPADGEAKAGAALRDHIYMDAMAFGMGCCCLQITFQAKDLEEATKVYDQLVPVAPIMVRPHEPARRSSVSLIKRSFLFSLPCRPHLRPSADIWPTLTVAGTSSRARSTTGHLASAASQYVLSNFGVHVPRPPADLLTA